MTEANEHKYAIIEKVLAESQCMKISVYVVPGVWEAEEDIVGFADGEPVEAGI